MTKRKQPHSKKVAMVQSPPRTSNSDQLHDYLEKHGNDRAFTFMRRDGSVFTVWFEGDDHPTVVTLD